MLGDHIHHGLWHKNGDSLHDAAENLLDFVLEKANLRLGMDICDIGCG